MSIVKKDILDSLCQYYNQILRGDLSKCLDLVLDNIIDALKNDNAVQLRGFGQFSVKSRQKRIGRNPKTGTRVEITAKKGVQWKMSKELFKKLNQDTTHSE